MEGSFMDYKELMRDTLRRIEHERERQAEKMELLDEIRKMLDFSNEYSAEIQRLKDESEMLQQQLAEEKQKRAELEMKLAEMGKLSADVAKKASQDDLQKAVRIYLNVSKRKTLSKREAAKTVITEMLTSAKLEIPDDIMELLDHLDDEQTDPRVVNVTGNYNDIHDNGGVNLNNKS